MPVQTDNIVSNTFLNTQIGDSSFFVDMSWVQSIERTDNLHKQPGAANIIGTIEFERNNLNVFSFAGLLNLQSKPQDNVTERVVIIKKQNIRMGLVLNSVAGIVEVGTDSVFAMPQIANSSLSSFFENIAISDSDLFLCISPNFMAGQDEIDIPVDLNQDFGAEENQSKTDKNGAHDTAGSNQILLFKVLDKAGAMSEYVFGMSISQVLQILEPQKILDVPCSPDFVYGLINWRNRPVPVIDLYKRVGLRDSQINDQNRFVIARTLSGGQDVCFPVCFDVNVRKLPLPHQKLSIDSDIDMSLTTGTFRADDYNLVIPDLDRVVFTET
ncbi:MAG: hypothetical protein GWM89_07280 [Candidatus Dadabacteria bacterium]|nr:hypothetical protein [Candidatus Dadabacteria bacterium]NIX15673.1 hypothetical protein [Candidatus Dadabacteria bacterium]NIY22215.1 hypothetical protein [Candidatus Dadabacteria bacterium]